MILYYAIVFQLICLAFIVWGFFHEDKLIAFEDAVKDKLIHSLKIVYKKFNEHKKNVVINYLSDLGLTVAKKD